MEINTPLFLHYLLPPHPTVDPDPVTVISFLRPTMGSEAMQKTVKYSSLVVLILQNTFLVIFMKIAMGENKPKFIKEMSVFYAEIIKFVASLIFCCLAHKSLRKGLADIYTECVHNKKDFAKVLVPSVVYTIQNILLYVAVDNLPSATFMVTYQLKILTTALFTVVVLKKRLSIVQWIALFILFVGIAVVQYDQKMSEDKGKENNSTRNSTGTSQGKVENSLIGFGSVLIACILSGFAGIYLEKILKKSSVSLWVRNFQLAGPSIVFSLLLAFGRNHNEIFKEGFNPKSVSSNLMNGFDWAVWTTVAISALGGLIVAVVIKFADNILKVIGAVFGYSLFPYRPVEKQVDVNRELGKGDYGDEHDEDEEEEEITEKKEKQQNDDDI